MDPSGQVSQEAAVLLADREALRSLLDDLVERVGMQILKPAEMLEVAPDPTRLDSDEDCGGVTGVVILTTSHGSIHTWPLRGQVSFDLYSCRDFDPEAVLAFLQQRLHLTGGTWTSVVRTFDSSNQRQFTRNGSP